MSDSSTFISQRGFEYGVQHLLSPRPGPLLDILAEYLQISSQTGQELLQLGAIYVDGQRCQQNADLAEKTYVRVHSRPRRFNLAALAQPERLIYEHEDFIIYNKPPAIPCHPTVDNIRENILAYLQQHLNPRLLLTHRLDVPTSGLLVFAKNKKFQSAFNQALQNDKTQKIYECICEGNLTTIGLVTHYMQDSPRAPKTVQNQEGPLTKKCELEILKSELCEENFSRVKIRLLTGRTHQIRAQLAALGHPIRGDVMYGAAKFFSDEQISLTASELEFCVDGYAGLFKYQLS